MRRLLPPALVALVAVAVFANTLSHEFVYDDRWVILENPRVHALGTWREILTSPWWPRGLYRPLTSFTFALNWVFDPGDPRGFHLVNIVLHAVAAVLLYGVASRLLPVRAALVAAHLFAVHPVHVEAVANVVGRAEVLATVFSLIAVLLYLRLGDRSEPGGALRAVGPAAAAVLALAGKESAFALPGILPVVDWTAARVRGEPFTRRVSRTWPAWAAVVLVSVLWLVLRSRVVGGLAGDTPAPGLQGRDVFERIVIMLPVVTQYLRLLLLPFRLSADYSPNFLPADPVFGAAAAVGLLLLLGLVALVVLTRNRAPVIAGGVAWTGAALLIVANIVIPTGVLLAERTLYLASAGACLALAAGWWSVYARAPAAAVAVAALLAGAGAVRTVTRAEVWRDGETFFPTLIADAPGSYRAEWVSGMLALQQGDTALGERLIRGGFEIYDGNGSMWRDFAIVTERQGRWKEAAGYFWRAFETDRAARGSDAARAVANLIQAGLPDSAAVLLEAAQGELPDSPDLMISESHLALARGDAARSLELRRRMAEENPADWRYWHLTAEAALPARDCTALTEALGRLRALHPRLRRTEQLADSARAVCTS